MIGINQTYNGDCLEVMKTFPKDCIDLTVTSPPYDNLRTYNGYTFDFEGIARQLFRVTKQGGVVVWVVGDATINGSETGTSFKQALYFKEIGFNLHDTMIWEKGTFSNPDTTRYYSIFEYMFILSRGKPKCFNPLIDRLNIERGKTNFGKMTRRQRNGDLKDGKSCLIAKYGMRHNIWRILTSSQENPCSEIKHPATFSEDLAQDHIYSWSNENDLILDPFCGSGTTLKMAHLQNRNWIGIDISKEYCELSEKRIKPYLMQTKMAI